MLSILQILCAYLGFDFAEEWYQKCNHKNIGYVRTGVHKLQSKLTDAIECEYTLLKEAMLLINHHRYHCNIFKQIKDLFFFCLIII